jgi:hypothetical protein
MSRASFDRVVLVTSHFESSLRLLSTVLGTTFTELLPGDDDPSRTAFSADRRIELIEAAPGDQTAPPHLQRWVGQLTDTPIAVAAVSFRVAQLSECIDTLRADGVVVETEMSFPDLAPLPICDVHEAILDERTTGGLPITLVQYHDQPR